MRVETILEDNRVFEPGTRVMVVQGKTADEREIEFSQIQHGRRIVKLRGIDSISQVEPLVGAELALPEDRLPATEDGQFYTFHLKGCRVVTEAGEDLGEVTDVLDTGGTGGTEILQVEDSEGKRGELLIPFAEAYLREVDVEGRRIVVDLPAGLRDLNR